MNKVTASFVLLTFLAIGSKALYAQDRDSLYMVSRKYNAFIESADILVRNNIVYHTTETALRIADASNPVNPVEISFFDDDIFYPSAIAIKDTIIYMQHSWGILEAINISNPYTPVRLDSLHLHSFTFYWYVEPGSIWIQNSMLYLASVYQGMYIIDISDPKELSLLSNFTYKPSPFWDEMYAKDIVVRDTLAYLSDREAIQLVNVKNPLNPFRVDRYFIPNYHNGGFNSLALSGNILYGLKSYALYALDISDPDTIETITHIDLPYGSANNLQVKDDKAYISSFGKGFTVVDVSDSYSLKITVHDSVEGDFRQVFTANDILYLTKAHDPWSRQLGGLKRFDISDLQNPSDLGLYNDMASVFGLELLEDHVVLGSNGVRILDISDPLNPSEIAAHIDDEYLYTEFDMLDGYAYLSAKHNDESQWDKSILKIIDLNTPAFPFETAAYRYSFLKMGNIYDIEVVNNFILLAGTKTYRDGIITVCDISDKSDLQIVGTFSSNEWDVEELFIVDSTAYSIGRNFFHILDISEPNDIHAISSIEMESQDYMRDLHIAGNEAFITGIDEEGTYLRVFDVSDPVNPNLLSRYEFEYYTPSILEIVDNLLYLSSPFLGIEVMDVSDPFSPAIIVSHHTSQGVSDIILDDRLIYASHGSYFGIYTFDSEWYHGINNSVPDQYTLLRNYPNPFNYSTNLEFEISESTNIEIFIYDAKGRMVDRLFTGFHPSGMRQITWNASSLPSGTYILQLNDGQSLRTSKAAVLR